MKKYIFLLFFGVVLGGCSGGKSTTGSPVLGGAASLERQEQTEMKEQRREVRQVIQVEKKMESTSQEKVYVR